MSRSHPYINKPPPAFTAALETLSTTSLLLLQTIGPTVFVIKTTSYSKPFKVYIGTAQRCTCGGGEGRGNLCVHILYVMTKVLRVPSDNPLSWQLSLTEPEIEQCLKGDFNTGAREGGRRAFLRRRKEVEKGVVEKGGGSKRQDLVEDEVCPICQDDMTSDDLAAGRLCYCESSCGANIHVRCLRMYGTHLLSEKKKVLCPLCRSDWGELPVEGKAPGADESTASKSRMSRFNNAMPAIKCKACKLHCKSSFTRCATCTPAYDLCTRCFKAPSTSAKHDMSHVFLQGDATACPVVWTAAVVPIDRGRLFGSLQGRDLSDADYHVLLSLDGDNVPPVQRHLIQALEKVPLGSVGKEDECKVCDTPLSSDTALRRFPCSGSCTVHESCALSVFIEACTNEGTVGGVSCPCCADGIPLFGSLVRRPKRKVCKEVAAEGGVAAVTTEGGEGDKEEGGFMLMGSTFGGNPSTRPPVAPTVGRANRVAIPLRSRTPSLQPAVAAADIEELMVGSDEAAPVAPTAGAGRANRVAIPLRSRTPSQQPSERGELMVRSDSAPGGLRGRGEVTVRGGGRVHRSPVTLVRARGQENEASGGGGGGMEMSMTSRSYVGSREGVGGALGATVNESRRGGAARFREQFASTGGCEAVGVVDFSGSITSSKLGTAGAGRALSVQKRGGGGRVARGRSGLGGGGVLVSRSQTGGNTAGDGMVAEGALRVSIPGVGLSNPP